MFIRVDKTEQEQPEIEGYSLVCRCLSRDNLWSYDHGSSHCGGQLCKFHLQVGDINVW